MIMTVKNFLSYFRYGIKNKKIHFFSLCINFVILATAIIGIAPQFFELLTNKSTSIWVTIFACLLIILDLVWQIISIVHELNEYFHKEYNCEVTIETTDFTPFVSVPDSKIISVHRGTFCYRKDICEALRTSNDFKYSIYSDASKKTDDYIRDHFSYLFPFLCKHYRDSQNDKKLFTNDSKLCLSGDISKNDDYVHLCRGSYYNTYLTNKIFLKKLVPNDSVDIMPIHGYSNRFMILPFDYFSNEIGVSTLAITLDGYLFFQEQGSQSDSSPDLIVPSGSGSADWQDYVKSKKNRITTFEGIISYSTMRELSEETGYKKHDPLQIVKKNKIIGFFRWMDYGGKPEFVSLSLINLKRDDIHPQRSEQKALNTDKYCFQVINRDGSFNDDELNRCFSTMNDDRCSLPLYVNLHFLKMFIEDSRPEFESFCKQ